MRSAIHCIGVSTTITCAGASEFGVVRSAREGDDVAYVCHTGNEKHEAFEAETETAVRHCAEAAGVEIPPHVFHRDVEFLDAAEKLVIVGFALGTTYDLADLREKDVHGADSLAVLVLLHIECLDVARIVGEDDGTLEVLFYKIALVLALQVDAPFYWEFEFLAGSLENLNAFGVCEADEIVVQNKFEAVDELFVEVLGEELDVVAAVVESVLNAVFHKLLGKVHIIGDVVERHFRLYHPELREMAGSIGVFSAECRTEGVDRTEGGSTEFAFELTADGESRRLAEEIFGVVYFPFFVARKLFKVEGCHLEHSSGTFAVAFGDERCVEIEKSSFLEKLMYCKCKGAAHAQDCAECGGAGAEMRFLAEEFEGMPFFLQGVCLGVGAAVDLKSVGLHFARLTLTHGFDKLAGDMERRACGDSFQLFLADYRQIENYLEIAHCAAVVEGDELHILITAASTYPAHYLNLAAYEGRVEYI